MHFSDAIKRYPRLAYLSWSKLMLWEKDPNTFYQVYIEGLDGFRTPYLELGKKLADALDGGDTDGDPMLEFMKVFVPSYEKREFDIKTNFEGVPIMGKLDTFSPKRLAIREYKSGKNWTQGKANKHGQLDFYALLVYLKYKKMPSEIWLDWAKTEQIEVLDEETGYVRREVKLTGDIKHFRVQKSMADLIRMGQRIKKAWSGIQEMIQTL